MMPAGCGPSTPGMGSHRPQPKPEYSPESADVAYFKRVSCNGMALELRRRQDVAQEAGHGNWQPTSQPGVAPVMHIHSTATPQQQQTQSQLEWASIYGYGNVCTPQSFQAPQINGYLAPIPINHSCAYTTQRVQATTAEHPASYTPCTQPVFGSPSPTHTQHAQQPTNTQNATTPSTPKRPYPPQSTSRTGISVTILDGDTSVAAEVLCLRP